MSYQQLFDCKKCGFGSCQSYVAENFVAQEFRAAGLRDLYGRQGHTSEVEFLLEGSENVTPAEVKSGRVTRAKSLTVYMERYHPRHAYVLMLATLPHRTTDKEFLSIELRDSPASSKGD